MQQKLGVLEQKTSLLIAMEFLSLPPANFSSHRNVTFMLAVLDHPAVDVQKLRRAFPQANLKLPYG